MREVLYRTVDEVIVGLGIGEARLSVSLKGDDRGGPAALGLLVREPHPHRGFRVDAAGEWQLMSLGNLTWEAPLREHQPLGRKFEKTIESRRGDEVPVQPIGAIQPVEHVQKRCQCIATHGKEDVISFYRHRHVERRLADRGVAFRNVRRRGDRLFQRESTPD